MRPSEQLEGMLLPNDWSVEKILTRKPTATGGRFSTGYLVRKSNGSTGFLKAMDYTEALVAPNSAQMLQWMTEAHLFEKQICEQCRTANLDRVVNAIDSGSLLATPGSPASKVEYLIFELAEHGDIRSHMDSISKLDNAFLLKTLHNVAVGLQQLHKSSMAHQDLKPSNVLVFGGGGSKIADLGRAWSGSLQGPHDILVVAGDRGYAPYELLYNQLNPAFTVRRFACDLYHLGSLIVFLFTRLHLNTLVIRGLPVNLRPVVFGGDFPAVLPHLQSAFATTLKNVEASFPEPFRNELLEMVRQLGEPDPLRRGHPEEHKGRGESYSLQRYISRLDAMSKRAALLK